MAEIWKRACVIGELADLEIENRGIDRGIGYQARQMNSTSASLNDFSNDFMKYRGPSATAANSNYPSYTTDSLMEQPTSSWLHGSDFNSLAGDLFSSTTGTGIDDISYGNLSGMNLNLDQIKIVNQIDYVWKFIILF